MTGHRELEDTVRRDDARATQCGTSQEDDFVDIEGDLAEEQVVSGIGDVGDGIFQDVGGEWNKSIDVCVSG